MVTLLHRFGQRVIIVGVPGAVSADLITASGNDADNIEVTAPTPVDKHQLKSSIVGMVKKGPSPLIYWTVRIIDQWSQNIRQGIPGTAKERRDAIHELIDEKVLNRQPKTDAKRGQVTEVVFDEAEAKKLGYIK